MGGRTSGQPAADQFVHLHVHSEYSMLDGAARVSDLFAEAARMQMPALAMTDHGNVFGAYEFWKKGTAAGVKPIIGMEAYITPGTSRFERTRVRWGSGGEDDVSGGGAFTHMTLLAETTEGMHNLFRLSSRASLEGYFYKPRADRELLVDVCQGPDRDHRLPVGGDPDPAAARGLRRRGQARPGSCRTSSAASHFFCEMMDHGLGIERRVHTDLLRLAARAPDPDRSPPTTCTTPMPRTPSRTRSCCACSPARRWPTRTASSSTPATSTSRRRRRCAQVWRELPEACDNTLLIAARCEVMFDENADLLPRFAVPEGHTEETWLRAEVERGLELRYPGGVPADAPRARCLRAWRHRRRWASPATSSSSPTCAGTPASRGIRVGPGRGSATGSLVSYALRITELDPIEHGLLFERFLNPERVSMPDIDLDFDERRRGDMIRYATEKYGEDRVSQIITYGTIKAKAGDQGRRPRARLPVRHRRQDHQGDAGAGHGQGHPAGRHLRPEARAVRRGQGVPRAVRGRRRRQEGRRHRRGRSKGCARQWGVHAAGVILSREPLARRDPDPAPGAGRRDHHAVRHGRVRGARPAEDGLPRPAQPDRARRRAAPHPGQPRRGGGPRDLAAGPSRGLRAALPRRHDRGLPARGRPDAVADPLDAAVGVRGHRRRSSRFTAPARWAWAAISPTSSASTGAQRMDPIHPSSRRRSPRSSPRPTA